MRLSLASLVRLGAIVSVVALWMILVPVASAGDPCYHGFEMPASTTASDDEIDLQPCAFSPTVTKVAVGATVTFVNGPEFAHLVTGANQAWGSRDVELQPNKSVAYTFEKAGIYPYACALHRGMSGVIVVGDVASAGGGTTGGAAGAGTTTTVAPQPGAASTPPTDDPRLVAIAAIGGLVVGALVVWAVMRRRTVRQEEPVAGIA